MTTMDRLNAALAKPITHVVLTKFDTGMVKRHETRCAQSAENFAIGERRKIGKTLIQRDPVTLLAAGDATVLSVEVVAL